MGSTLTSHLRATYDAAVNKVSNGLGKFAQVQASWSQASRSEAHSRYIASDEKRDVTTLLSRWLLLRKSAIARDIMSQLCPHDNDIAETVFFASRIKNLSFTLGNQGTLR